MPTVEKRCCVDVAGQNAALSSGTLQSHMPSQIVE